MKHILILIAALFTALISSCAEFSFVSERDGLPQIHSWIGSNTYHWNLSNNDYTEHFPDVSHDGKWIAFSSIRSPGSENIYIMDFAGENVRALTSGSGKRVKPRWSPTGLRITFSEYIADNRARLVELNPFSNNPATPLTSPPVSQSDSGGHDYYALGQKILFSRYDGNRKTYDLYYKRRTITDPPTAITTTNNEDETLPVTSHNGQYLAYRISYTFTLARGRYTIDAIQLAAVDSWEIINTFFPQSPVSMGTISGITFSSDDTRILFSARKSAEGSSTALENYEIFSVNLDGTNQQQVTSNNYADYSPSSKPDRWVTIEHNPTLQKQGDLMEFQIKTGDSGSLQEINYQVFGYGEGEQLLQEGTVPTATHSFTVDTCKERGTYFTSLYVTAQAVYNDGEMRIFQRTYDLTTGNVKREDSDTKYSIYIAENLEEEAEDAFISASNEFMDRFNRYSLSQYFWAEPRLYTDESLFFANSVDMLISFGHGHHHHYNTGNGEVDFATTAFGNFVPCYHSGDLEYLIQFSCETLSLNTYSSMPFDYFWWHREERTSKLNPRPFTGLHMVLGFRSRAGGTTGEIDDFFHSLADNLDAGMLVRDAWFEAAYDALDFDGGLNRSTVFGISPHFNDRLSSDPLQHGDDFIYGNPKYLWWVEYLD